MNLELATAAFYSDGVMLNSVVDNAPGNTPANTSNTTSAPAKSFRAQQQIDFPLAAATLRVAMQDANTGHLGIMEIKLFLVNENGVDAEKHRRLDAALSQAGLLV